MDMIKSKYNDNGSIIFALENLLYFREIENNICEQYNAKAYKKEMSKTYTKDMYKTQIKGKKKENNCKI